MARATIRDVARVAGVSDGTVSNTLNRPHLVNAETRERVQQAMAAVGYVPNAAARALRVGRSRTIGLVVLDFGNPFFAEVAAGAEQAATDAGADVALFNTGIGRHARESRLLHRLAERRLDGLIITPNDVDDPLLAVIEERGTPVVVLAREVPSRRRSAVRSDDVLGGELAARHLLENGHRHLAYAGWRHDERYIGAVHATGAAGARLTWIGTASDGFADGLAAGERLTALPAEDRPSAVFCANDLIATGLVQSVTHRGLRIPSDLAVVGFDDTELASAACAVGLTSVHQPAAEIGRAAVRLVLDEMNNPGRVAQDVVFAPELVVRESTGPIVSASRGTTSA
ncbi:LacI family transcriptional regulator [Actinoplanes lutulentus]|uniref:LacI family transcriptional regulator n=1 Tax=Actinoplanes lutulentus TaxID=1287878 RepID=A0A327ZL75_9ACTN|nr:LacI family DNA-binding transcriptional regulator [Actinoplanes lutulentus]MBB2940730.1 LacI family transcriptional regulator [Actinoplanes lutulentus]RAK43041.1 LacI family transcriptional regulator [Actinoplanes lutulentus]